MPSDTCWLLSARHAPRIPQAVDGERGRHDAALEDFQDRAAEEAVLVNRV